MRTVFSLFAVGSIALAGWAVGCSDTGGGSNVNGGGAGGGTGGSGATGGFAATGGSGATGGVGADAGAGGGTSLSELCNSACACDTHDGELSPLDMLIVLDKSGSMTGGDGEPNKWTPVTGAISQFMGLPGTEGISVGLSFFPVRPSQTPSTLGQSCTALPADDGSCAPYACVPGTQGGKCACEGLAYITLGVCNPTTASCIGSDYETPAVEIAPLPGVESQINGAISAASPDGEATPMGPALEGGIKYARNWAAAHPDHITIVVLATDGNPEGCNPNRVDTVAAHAEVGLNGTPSVTTYVIGLGDLASLTEIATKGGGEAFIISGGNTGQDFLDALNQIRGAAGCTFKIPQPSGGETPNFERVNVAFTDGSGAEQVFGKVGSGAECGSQDGWYYDNPQSPSKIELCPVSCAKVESDGMGVVNVILGCDTIPR